MTTPSPLSTARRHRPRLFSESPATEPITTRAPAASSPPAPLPPASSALLYEEELDQLGRFFSNIKYDDDATAARSEGSVFGAAALVTGTTVGAGILALPAVTLSSGLGPSSLLLGGVWVYMACSGLLIAEVNLNSM